MVVSTILQNLELLGAKNGKEWEMRIHGIKIT